MLVFTRLFQAKCPIEELKGIAIRVTQRDVRVMWKSLAMTYSIQSMYGSMYGIYSICMCFTASIHPVTRWEFLIYDLMLIFFQISQLDKDEEKFISH